MVFLIIPFVSLVTGEDDEIVHVNFCYNASYEGEGNRLLCDYESGIIGGKSRLAIFYIQEI